jgi:hypothetical protein
MPRKLRTNSVKNESTDNSTMLISQIKESDSIVDEIKLKLIKSIDTIISNNVHKIYTLFYDGNEYIEVIEWGFSLFSEYTPNSVLVLNKFQLNKIDLNDFNNSDKAEKEKYLVYYNSNLFELSNLSYSNVSEDLKFTISEPKSYSVTEIIDLKINYKSIFNIRGILGLNTKTVINNRSVINITVHDFVQLDKIITLTVWSDNFDYKFNSIYNIYHIIKSNNNKYSLGNLIFNMWF